MDGHPVAILVCSDSFPAETLKAPLQESGISTTTCSDCAGLKEVLEVDKPQLIFTEAELADGNWHEVVILVRKHSPQTKVVVVGVQSDPRLEFAVRDCGAHAYMATPPDWYPFHILIMSAHREFDRQRNSKRDENPAEQALGF